MAEIVSTNIDTVAQFDGANWYLGVQDSYEKTKVKAAWNNGFSIIGRRDRRGLVQPVLVSRKGGEWATITGWHLQIARFFEAKLENAPGGDALSPFFESIDDLAVADAVRQVASLDNANSEEDTVSLINSRLRDLGVPAGDWSYLPMLSTLRSAIADRRSLN